MFFSTPPPVILGGIPFCHFRGSGNPGFPPRRTCLPGRSLSPSRSAMPEHGRRSLGLWQENFTRYAPIRGFNAGERTGCSAAFVSVCGLWPAWGEERFIPARSLQLRNYSRRLLLTVYWCRYWWCSDKAQARSWWGPHIAFQGRCCSWTM